MGMFYLCPLAWTCVGDCESAYLSGVYSVLLKTFGPLWYWIDDGVPFHNYGGSWIIKVASLLSYGQASPMAASQIFLY